MGPTLGQLLAYLTLILLVLRGLCPDRFRAARLMLTVSFAVVFVVAFLQLSVEARAHTVHDHGSGLSMTYDSFCCGGHDCAPATAVSHTPSGELVVTSPHGTATVDANTSRLESKDHRVHICIVNKSARCLYLPPGL